MRLCHSSLAFTALLLAVAAAKADQHGEVPGKRIAGAGDWHVHSGEGSVSHRRQKTLFLLAASGANLDGVAPILNIRCQAGVLDIYIDWRTFVNDGPRQVVEQVDGGKRMALDWNVSTDFNSTFRPSSTDLLQLLQRAKRYVATTDPYSQEPIRATFEVGGFPKAMRQLERDCPPTAR